MTLTFRVVGVASGMGSKRAFVPKGWARPIVTDSNRNLKAWQSLIAEAAGRAIADQPMILGGVRVTVAFALPRPKTLPRKVTAHTKAPDIDKLLRALNDALSGIVYRDDAQVVDLIAIKRYAAAGQVPHVDVTVEPSAGIIPVAAIETPLFASL